VRTSLGEESAESMVIIGSFTLLSEVTIGLNVLLALRTLELNAMIDSYLNAVLEAVKLWYFN